MDKFFWIYWSTSGCWTKRNLINVSFRKSFLKTCEGSFLMCRVRQVVPDITRSVHEWFLELNKSHSKAVSDFGNSNLLKKYFTLLKNLFLGLNKKNLQDGSQRRRCQETSKILIHVYLLMTLQLIIFLISLISLL